MNFRIRTLRVNPLGAGNEPGDFQHATQLLRASIASLIKNGNDWLTVVKSAWKTMMRSVNGNDGQAEFGRGN